jgi:hypothetical protein
VVGVVFGRELVYEVQEVVDAALKVVDRRHDRYTEKVVNPHTDKIIHKCEEPLREHRDHGSARPRD